MWHFEPDHVVLTFSLIIVQRRCGKSHAPDSGMGAVLNDWEGMGMHQMLLGFVHCHQVQLQLATLLCPFRTAYYCISHPRCQTTLDPASPFGNPHNQEPCRTSTVDNSTTYHYRHPLSLSPRFSSANDTRSLLYTFDIAPAGLAAIRFPPSSRHYFVDARNP